MLTLQKNTRRKNMYYRVRSPTLSGRTQTCMHRSSWQHSVRLGKDSAERQRPSETICRLVSHVMKAEQPGASFTFKFNGSMFGVFDIGAPESAQLEIELDGKPVKLKPMLPGTRFPEATMDDGRPLLDRFSFFQTAATAASLIV